MNIKKFEAYTYRGPAIDKIDRKGFLEEIFGQFEDGKFIDYDINGTMYSPKEETLFIFLTKLNGVAWDNKVVKLDFSDLGIEIGNIDSEESEPEDFVPEINLDSEQTKQMKSYKNDIKKYNV